MRLRSFRAERVYGQIDINIDFNERLTFLTGRNGSGKTTALRIIMSLLQPNLGQLVILDLASARLELIHNQNRCAIVIERKGDALELTSSETDSMLSIPIIKRDRSESSPRYLERFEQFISEIEAKNATNSVREFIGSLPTPMFLGLERRIDAGGVDDFVRRPRYIPRPRGPLSGSLSESVSVAQQIAERHFRKVQATLRNAASELRRNLILLPFDSNPTARERSVRMPTATTISKLENDYALLKQFLPAAGINSEDIEARIGSHVKRLSQMANEIINYKIKSISDGLRDDKTRPISMDWFLASSNRQALDRTLHFVRIYAKEQEEIMRKTNAYLTVLNNFLDDSGKSLEYSEEGDLIVRARGGQTMSPQDMSSGESHIFAIFSHLFFFDEDRGSEILIVDEPELSLHIRWQELFVDSIAKVGPNLQAILATHSPSIILDRIELCKEVRAW